MIDNPVLRKELLMRFRFRQWSQSSRLGIFLAIVVLIGLIYWLFLFQGLLADPSPETGFHAWTTLVEIQYGLICLIAPAITANCITQEKEQQTWDMLIFTNLKPTEIIFGKLLARLSPLALLLIVFMPLELLSWAYSHHTNLSGSSDAMNFGVDFSQVVLSYLVMISSAFCFATFGLYMSWLVQRTLYAIMLSYTFVIGTLILGTTLVTLALSTLFTDPDFLRGCALLWVNPVMLCSYSVSLPGDRVSDLPHLFYGVLGYITFAVILIVFMVTGFRRFSFQQSS